MQNFKFPQLVFSFVLYILLSASFLLFVAFLLTLPSLFILFLFSFGLYIILFAFLCLSIYSPFFYHSSTNLLCSQHSSFSSSCLSTYSPFSCHYFLILLCSLPSPFCFFSPLLCLSIYSPFSYHSSLYPFCSSLSFYLLSILFSVHSLTLFLLSFFLYLPLSAPFLLFFAILHSLSSLITYFLSTFLTFTLSLSLVLSHYYLLSPSPIYNLVYCFGTLKSPPHILVLSQSISVLSLAERLNGFCCSLLKYFPSHVQIEAK